MGGAPGTHGAAFLENQLSAEARKKRPKRASERQRLENCAATRRRLMESASECATPEIGPTRLGRVRPGSTWLGLLRLGMDLWLRLACSGSGVCEFRCFPHEPLSKLRPRE